MATQEMALMMASFLEQQAALLNEQVAKLRALAVHGQPFDDNTILVNHHPEAHQPEEGATGKGKRKPKAPVDPNKPKRPPNGYSLFVQDMFHSDAFSVPPIDGANRMTKAAQMWNEIEEDKKLEYQDRAGDLKAAYEEKMKKYLEEKSAGTASANGERTSPAASSEDTIHASSSSSSNKPPAKKVSKAAAAAAAAAPSSSGTTSDAISLAAALSSMSQIKAAATAAAAAGKKPPAASKPKAKPTPKAPAASSAAPTPISSLPLAPVSKAPAHPSSSSSSTSTAPVAPTSSFLVPGPVAVVGAETDEKKRKKHKKHKHDSSDDHSTEKKKKRKSEKVTI